MRLRIFPPEELMDVQITLPLSKSISNRALIINALTPDSTPLSKVADCDDTEAMITALSSQNNKEVNIGAAGTAMRFLTAYFAVQPGREVTLTGSDRMCNRPIAPLVDALKSIGADISYVDKDGFPPLAIKGKSLAGGTVRIDAGVSSQYISALMMIAPVLEKGLAITLEGDIISMPYIRMTAQIMEQYGVTIEIEGNRITVPHSKYTPPQNFEIEADWSAASYWFEIQALTCGWTTLSGLQEKSCQGDSSIVELFRELGVETGFEKSPLQASLEASPDLSPRFYADLSSTPDVAQTFAVTCAMLGVPFRLSGLRSLRIKETDRIDALYRELLKVGVVLETEGDEAISWDGVRRPVSEIPAFDTYSDHRMALSLAPVAVFIPGIIINDAEVVTKSYPGYWDDLRKAGFNIEDCSESTE